MQAQPTISETGITHTAEKTASSAMSPLAVPGHGCSLRQNDANEALSRSDLVAAVSQALQQKLSDAPSVVDFDTPSHAVAKGMNRHLIVPAGMSLTVNIPSDVPTIPDALSAIASWEIYGSVIIQVADGNYTLPASIILNHPYGDHISLVGNTIYPSKCRLRFSGTNGIEVSMGSHWNSVNGFELINMGKKANLGIFTYGGQINAVGPNVIVDNFYYGIAALNGGRLSANGTSEMNRVEVRNAGDVGIWAISHSFVSANYAYVHDSVDAPHMLGGGLVAEFASTIVANNAISAHNYIANIISQSGSAIRAWNGVYDSAGILTNQVRNPNPRAVANVITNSMGMIEIFGSTLTHSLGFGDMSDGTSYIFGGAGSSKYYNNILGNTNIPVNIGNDGSMHVNSGSLSIDATKVNGTQGSTYFDQNIPKGKSAITRYLTVGTEIWRQQWNEADRTMTWSMGKGGNGLIYDARSGQVMLNSLKTQTDIRAPALPSTNPGGIKLRLYQ
ncbi:hypothetical protein [Novacetimonas pomaceti]|uniref:hypothetical protein n=1 Tax=Novacetimonas pomaceti TaxID=2021998 RepID=UPI001C2CF54D|nr:hypothetical protein [Novacetimonas pomaceti]MBV1835291.1 hypothetical protein [Novacetimonas pomaceti]